MILYNSRLEKMKWIASSRGLMKRSLSASCCRWWGVATRRVFLACILFLALTGLWQPAIHAQSGDVDWAEPIKISDDVQGNYPVIAADPSGGVHVLFPEVRQEGLDGSNVIYYVYWDGATWSTPVDVLASPDGSRAEFLALAAGPDGKLHLIWHGQRLYYSSAPANAAASARAWSSLQAITAPGQLWYPDIVASSTNILHVAYPQIDSPRGLYYIQSRDGGNSWSQPIRVSSEPEEDRSPMHVRLYVDAKGDIYVVWSEYSLPAGWPPLGVFYARSSDGGQSWSEPFEVAEGPYDLINMAVVGDDEIHLVWSGTGEAKGRYHRWSPDGGRTWTPTEKIFVGVGGFHHFPGMAVDSGGTLYLVTAGVDPTQHSGGQLFFSYWTGQSWASRESITGPIGDFYSAEMVVSEGNRLNVTFFDENQRTIWYAMGRTSAPYQPPQPLPTLAPTPTALPASTSAPASTATPRPDTSFAPEGSTEAAGGGRFASPSYGVAAGVLPVILFLVFFVLVWIKRR